MEKSLSTYRWVIGILLIVIGLMSGLGLASSGYGDQVITNTANISNIKDDVIEIKRDVKVLLSRTTGD